MNMIPQDTPRNKPFALTAFQREEICHRYVLGESTVALGKAYGVSRAAIRHLLITRDIARREYTTEAHRTYHCNHTYFDEPLDEERAYWIGFLLADGWVSLRSNRVDLGMSLSITDIGHVEKFRKALQSNHPIGQYTATRGYGIGKKTARLTIASKELVNAVARYGIVAHKTKICITPQIPVDLMRHMYRGYVDGDGGLSLYKTKTSRGLHAAFDVVGTKSFLQDFGFWLVMNAGANPLVPLKSNNTTAIMNLRYGGLRQVSDILHVLYDDTTIYLERKLRLAQDIWYAAENQQSHRRHDY